MEQSDTRQSVPPIQCVIEAEIFEDWLRLRAAGYSLVQLAENDREAYESIHDMEG